VRTFAKVALAALLAVALVALPALAEACPQCASREGSGMATVLMLGSMILLPFGVFFVVLRVVKRVESRSRALADPQHGEPG
jgi:hypothetical protein